MQWLKTLLVCFVLMGCAVSPEKAAEITVEGFVSLSEQLDDAERRGQISSETEIELQKDIRDALLLMRSGVTTGNITACDSELTNQQCLQDILLKVEQALLEAEL